MEFKLQQITLRTVTHQDVEEVARMWNFENGEITKEDAIKAIEWMDQNHQKNSHRKLYHLCFAIFHNATNKIIGWCGLDGRCTDDKYQGAPDLFYLIDRNYRNQGFATQSASQVLSYGFNTLELDCIIGRCKHGNIASARVLDKLGMRKTEEVQSKLEHTLVYELTREEYNLFFKPRAV